MKTNFIFHEDFVKIFKKVLHLKGVLNIGGPHEKQFMTLQRNTIKKLKKKYLKKVNKKLPLNTSMNLSKINKFS